MSSRKRSEQARHQARDAKGRFLYDPSTAGVAQASDLVGAGSGDGARCSKKRCSSPSSSPSRSVDSSKRVEIRASPTSSCSTFEHDGDIRDIRGHPSSGRRYDRADDIHFIIRPDKKVTIDLISSSSDVSDTHETGPAQLKHKGKETMAVSGNGLGEKRLEKKKGLLKKDVTKGKEKAGMTGSGKVQKGRKRKDMTLWKLRAELAETEEKLAWFDAKVRGERKKKQRLQLAISHASEKRGRKN